MIIFHVKTKICFLIYIVCLFVFALYLVGTNPTGQWAYFFDKAFAYLFAPGFLLVCAVIDQSYNLFTWIRLESRKQLMQSHLFSYIFLAIVGVTVIYLFIILWALVVWDISFLYPMSNFVDGYFRMLLCVMCVGSVTLLLRYSGVKCLRSMSHVATLILVIADLLARPHILRNLSLPRFSLVFSWMNNSKIAISYIALGAINVVLILLLQWRIRREDLMG